MKVKFETIFFFTDTENSFELFRDRKVVIKAVLSNISKCNNHVNYLVFAKKSSLQNEAYQKIYQKYVDWIFFHGRSVVFLWWKLFVRLFWHISILWLESRNRRWIEAFPASIFEKIWSICDRELCVVLVQI